MTVQIEKWDFFELALPAHTTGNPFLDVSFAADFNLRERQVHVSGFYDGEDTFKLRFMPDQEGSWQYVTHSNLPALDGQTGALTCTPPAKNNHGPVKVANKFHFAYADGTPYIPVGTTCYVWNLQGDELENQTLKTLDTAPFNKMRMCVFPKRYSFNTNEPPSYPFPGKITRAWEPSMMRTYRFSEPPKFWDFSQFNPEYFQRLDRRILDLRDRGIEADLILFHPYDAGAWGFDRMPREVNDRVLQYLVARLGAFRNMWWSFANEYDLFTGWTMEDWDHSMELVQKIDPFDHLRSIHNCFSFYDHTKSWVTHSSIQSHNIYRVPLWREKYGKPVVIDECGYEGDIHMMWGDLSAEEMTLRFWHGFTQGGYVGHGETYVNEKEELWWSKGGKLVGESVPRIAFLRSIFEQAPDLQPILKPDNESINALESDFFARRSSDANKSVELILTEGRWNCEAGGFNADAGYFIFYFGMHQPRLRNFNIPAGSYKVDLIDTWNMTIETVAEGVIGSLKVKLPGRKFMAIRIQKNA
jgi:hypothetical protein